MRRAFDSLRLLACALLLWAGMGAWAAVPIQHWQQPSGAQVYLVESRSIPMVDIQIDFDAGGRRDPAGQAGLASVTAAMTGRGVLAHGGQPALDENQLSQAWADLGAGFGGEAGSDRMSFSLRSLTDPALLDRAVELAARQFGEPAFPPAVWDRDRQRMSAAIREANTRPGTVASKAFDRAVYDGHPYGAEVTEASLAAIEVPDMQAFFRIHVLPCRAKVSVVGDVDRATVDAIVARMLSRLPQAGGACPALPPVPDVPPLAAPATVAIPFDSAQAHVLIGQPGYERSDPDHLALVVGNYILGGGGLVSRLSTEVREKRGLSYGAYSYFSPGLHAGAFTIGLQTRPDQADEAIAVARRVLAGYVAEGPTQAELKAARDYLVGGFPLRIDSNGKLLGNVAAIAWHGLPLDYLDTWTEKVARITAAQVRAALQRKLDPARMATVTVGAKP